MVGWFWMINQKGFKKPSGVCLHTGQAFPTWSSNWVPWERETDSLSIFFNPLSHMIWLVFPLSTGCKATQQEVSHKHTHSWHVNLVATSCGRSHSEIWKRILRACHTAWIFLITGRLSCLERWKNLSCIHQKTRLYKLELNFNPICLLLPTFPISPYCISNQ